MKDEIEQMNIMRRNGSKANKFSEQIVMQSRKTKINEIFDRLDSDNDGLISTARMNFEGISEELIEIFKPLFIELE
jgi:Ca2+-binding EF-hand superfamily protein